MRVGSFGSAGDREPPAGGDARQPGHVAFLVVHADDEPVAEAEQMLDELAAARRGHVVEPAPGPRRSGAAAPRWAASRPRCGQPTVASGERASSASWARSRVRRARRLPSSAMLANQVTVCGRRRPGTSAPVPTASAIRERAYSPTGGVAARSGSRLWRCRARVGGDDERGRRRVPLRLVGELARRVGGVDRSHLPARRLPFAASDLLVPTALTNLTLLAGRIIALANQTRRRRQDDDRRQPRSVPCGGRRASVARRPRPAGERHLRARRERANGVSSYDLLDGAPVAADRPTTRFAESRARPCQARPLGRGGRALCAMPTASATSASSLAACA